MAAPAEMLIRPPAQTNILAGREVSPLIDQPPGEGLPGDGENFVLAHGAVEVPGSRDPVEYTISIPETLRSPAVHMLVPGFGGVKRLSRGLRDKLSGQENLATVSFEPAREGGYVRDLLDPQRVHFDTLTAILEDLPDNEQLQDMPNGDSLDFSRVVLLPHSMGALAATERARKYPDKTQSVIYMGSIGLEPQVMFEFVGRFLASAGRDTAGKFMHGKLVPGVSRLNLAYRVGNYYLRNPVRTIGELASCFAADVRKPVKLISELGVKTAALYFDEDRLVPTSSEIVEAARSIVHICELMEGFGHLAPQRRASEVAAAVGSISSRLEQI